jgi:hypothetical protein
MPLDFECRRQDLTDGRGYRYQLSRDSAPLPHAEVLELWCHHEPFRSFFIALLSEISYRAFRWETPPVTRGTVERDFEFVILDSPGIDLPADPADFSEHFTAHRPGDGIVVFENLGRDAVLVVPVPLGTDSAYSHLAAFARQAPASQQHALWRVVGDTMQKRLSERPLWLSTAGGGVPWLHVRLDSRPKYYGFEPYTRWSHG